MGAGKEDFESLMVFMPEGWEAKAKELGALQRARNVKTAEGLLKLILLYLTEGKSFAGTSDFSPPHCCGWVEILH